MMILVDMKKTDPVLPRYGSRDFQRMAPTSTLLER